MKICEYCDIVYSIKECPLCIADEEIQNLKLEIEELQSMVSK
jgi:hypothetical protein